MPRSRERLSAAEELKRPKVPEGLERCFLCDKYKGTVTKSTNRVQAGQEVHCLCGRGGATCKECQLVRVHAPMSAHYDEREGGVWWTPSFAAIDRRCSSCRERGDKQDAIRHEILKALKANPGQPFTVYLRPFLRDENIFELIRDTSKFRNVEYELDLAQRRLTFVELLNEIKILPEVFSGTPEQQRQKALELEEAVRYIQAIPVGQPFYFAFSEAFERVHDWQVVTPLHRRILRKFKIGRHTEQSILAVASQTPDDVKKGDYWTVVSSAFDQDAGNDSDQD